MLITEEMKINNGSSLDINSGFLTYIEVLKDVAFKIHEYIDKLYMQIPAEEYKKDKIAIDTILADRLCEEIFTAKDVLSYLNYKPTMSAIDLFITDNEKRIGQLLAENPTLAKYVTYF